ncbi:hypothetical protein GCM10009837_68500 [Streptomyces durmitorensis]|uniref:Uncharacterized protein n=1 Tax=Streptomyces durmitorensis TaxID=319947 RepID=A0ABY4PKL0_9ACTN|nr:hypothetical protein [Streptomyces durmitorensis]UQT53616.1 hypothetical protein M4V62_00145 [Streptomyces durmitorensis]
MHNAMPAVALHGPDEVTTAGEDLYAVAMDMTGAIFHLDAAGVQGFVLDRSFHRADVSQETLQAALDDLDTAYARLAAPLVPEFSARAEESLKTRAAVVDLARLSVSRDGSSAAAAVLTDLRRTAAQDAELRQLIEPFRAYEAYLADAQNTLTEPGIHADEQAREGVSGLEC